MASVQELCLALLSQVEAIEAGLEFEGRYAPLPFRHDVVDLHHVEISFEAFRGVNIGPLLVHIHS